MKKQFMKKNWVFMLNIIKYVSFKAVYCHTIIKCYIKVLKYHHLTMRDVPLIDKKINEA